MTDPTLFTHVVFAPYGWTPIGWYAANTAGHTEPLFSSDFRDLSSVLSGFDVQQIVREYYTQTFPRQPVSFLLLSPTRYLGGITQPRWKVLEQTGGALGLEVYGDGNRYLDSFHHADTWDEAQS
jgi:hypothetical protein